jgi:hypothetical protein
MKPCDGRRGLLFLSRDGSGNQAAKELAGYLTQSVMTFNFARNAPRQKEWNERTAFLQAPHAGVSLFKSPPKKPCIIVAGLDCAPNWLFARLKELMDVTRVRPFNCLATATTLEPIPDGLRSHFWVCRKVGRTKLL